MEKGAKIFAKYSHPVSTILSDIELTYERYAIISLNASDEQIVREFAIWLKQARSGDNWEAPQKLFTHADFADWHDARILPFFDLTTIAKIENVTIPLHAIGNALFPDKIEIDVAERVRKVTKRKVAQVFTYEVISALAEQRDSNGFKAE